MLIDVITLFPDIIKTYISFGVIKKAIEESLLNVRIHNLRDFTKDRHRTVDDYPYGGGSGMVLKPEPVFEAVEQIKSDGIERVVILLTPQGKVFNQQMARELSGEKRGLLLICGRYEAVDERVRSVVDEEISIGDYVLTGGELPALVIIDAVSRLLPGVLGNYSSTLEESFEWGILDYPHYTRPPEFRGMKVPEILLSGDHEAIRKWRRKEALRRTLERRPDLLEKAVLSEEDLILIKEIKEEL
ncbi:MAG: tRNA (guanosine(37)-N1)-methyltransferase TrmD [Thermodesulfovibrionales bacterium]|nr:tRNA (guanosine(37)-N1)-methyltransferase TrmD [Thermodesulfovibrionales bacterium]